MLESNAKANCAAPVSATLMSIVLTIVIPSSAHSASAETTSIQIEGSECVLVVQGVETEDISLLCPPKPEQKRHSVKYIWLDSTQTAFMLARFSDESLHPILGKRPIVALNSVYKNLERIFKKYGVKYSDISPEETPQVSEIHAYRNKSNDSNGAALRVPFKNGIDSIPINVRRNLIFPFFEQDLIWPDPEFVADAQDPGWPTKYKYQYNPHPDESEGQRLYLREMERSAKRKQAELTDKVAQCMSMRRPLNKDEFDRYWAAVDELENSLSEEKIYPWQFSAFVGLGEAESIVQTMAGNPTYDFYAEIGKEYWPDDFLAVDGSITNGIESENGCDPGPSGGLDFYVSARLLSTLVAVITPVDGEITVSAATLRKDYSTKLRSEPRYIGRETEDLGDISLSSERGDSLIIPLHTELKNSTETFQTDEPSAQDLLVYDIFKRYPDSPVNFLRCDYAGEDSAEQELKCSSFIRKTLKDFPLPAPVTTAPTYYFGPALALEELEVNGTSVPVRGAPELALAADVESGRGSCPFLYFEDSNGTETYYGRVLVGANSSAKMQTDVVPIPDDATRIVIREFEPEVTFLTGIGFVSSLFDKPLFPVSMQKVGPSEEIKVDIPEGSRSLRISGFYVPLAEGQPDTAP